MLVSKKIISLAIVIMAVVFLLPIITVQAQGTPDAYYGVNDIVEQGANLAKTDLRTLIANIINVALGFLGVIGVIIVLYGGFIWMTSAGDSQKIDRAKRIIINGAIGIAIILAAYGIVALIFNVISGGIRNGGNNGNNPPGGGYQGGTGLGGGALESHYPARNARNVPRNTMIYVTFKEAMDVTYIVDNPVCAGNTCVGDAKINYLFLKNLQDDSEITGSDLKVTYDQTDKKTFEIDPYGTTATHLGVSSGNTKYRVRLDGFMTESNHDAFPLTGFYDWNFTVSNVLDETPPTITDVSPADTSTNNPLNSTVQINFSEAIMPSTASGAQPPFNNIEVKDQVGNLLVGTYVIANQYRTVEFNTDALCGQNSCGGDVYCLPASQTISALVKTAIKDMAGNSLAADYPWSFTTSNAVDLSAPIMTFMDQNDGADLVAPIELKFNKALSARSVNSENIDLYKSVLGDTNYWMTLTDSGQTIQINHDKFVPLTVYKPSMTGQIKDTLQNCWFPCRCSDPASSSCTCSADGNAACAAGTDCQVP